MPRLPKASRAGCAWPVLRLPRPWRAGERGGCPPITQRVASEYPAQRARTVTVSHEGHLACRLHVGEESSTKRVSASSQPSRSSAIANTAERAAHTQRAMHSTRPRALSQGPGCADRLRHQRALLVSTASSRWSSAATRSASPPTATLAARRAAITRPRRSPGRRRPRGDRDRPRSRWRRRRTALRVPEEQRFRTLRARSAKVARAAIRLSCGRARTRRRSRTGSADPRLHPAATTANASRAAARVASITAPSCALDTNPASNADGARNTPRSSIAWKKRSNAAVSQAMACA